MPIYEYTCRDCRRKVSLLWRSFADAENREPTCPRCGGHNLERLISRVAVVRSEASQADSLADDAALEGIDENDPKSVARWMRKMASESGEDMPPEFDEVVSRLESGQDPESIEKSMPELAESLGEAGSPEGLDGDDL